MLADDEHIHRFHQAEHGESWTKCRTRNILFLLFQTENKHFTGWSDRIKVNENWSNNCPIVWGLSGGKSMGAKCKEPNFEELKKLQFRTLTLISPNFNTSWQQSGRNLKKKKHLEIFRDIKYNFQLLHQCKYKKHASMKHCDRGDLGNWPWGIYSPMHLYTD